MRLYQGDIRFGRGGSEERGGMEERKTERERGGGRSGERKG